MQRGERSKTLTFAQAGISDAGALCIFMDTEDREDDLTPNRLVLTGYGSGGQILFRGSPAAPIAFGDEDNGQGHGDRASAASHSQTLKSAC